MDEFGRYRLESRLGRGGMAEVFAAIAEGEGGVRRRVAIKRMLPELAHDPASGRMFLDEARIASQLHHAGIVAVLDYGTVDGVAFQVLDFVDGRDAERLCVMAAAEAQSLPLSLALHIGVQVARALHYAHEATDAEGRALRIVHRDVSPSNVLISWNGDVRLSDFGIAIAENRLERTEAGAAKGKLRYMAPEQASGGSVDRRADVFSLACLVHRLAVGHSPLADPDAMAHLLRGEALPLDPRLPAALREALAAALERSPARRPQTAAEFGDTLGSIAAQLSHEEPGGALQRWLAQFRQPVASERPRSVLDAMLDLDLVLAGTTDGVRSFTVRDLAVAATRSTAEGVDDAQTQVDQLTDRSAQSGRRLLSRALVVCVLIALAALLLTRELRRQDQTEPVTPAATAPSIPAPDSKLAKTVPPVAVPNLETSVPAKAGSSVGEANDAPRPVPSRAATPAAPRRATRSEAATSTPVPAATATLGSLLVGGAGALRAEIIVDGHPAGFAPKRLDLPLGAHSVELRSPAGERIAARQLTLTARHSPGAPLTWLLP